MISQSLASSLCELSQEINRKIGVTIDRRGKIKHVIVGNTEQLFIPDLGRTRGGKDRFRGIRLIHTNLRQESITDDDLTDLIRLRLDLIASINFDQFARATQIHYTHLMPSGSNQAYAEIQSLRLEECTVNVNELIQELEEEFSRSTVGAQETEGQIRGIAVHVSVNGSDQKILASLQELNELARTAGVIIVDAMVQKRKLYDPKFVMGRGKLDELLLLTMQLDCDLLIFDQDLSPHQVRAISEVTDIKVIDRSLLILDIFARRAHTREGKLAVELAQHKYLLPRLAHKNTAFSRLAGGIGGRGPGESKLEIDRRRARDRIHWLEKNLAKAKVQRENQRARRRNNSVPQVAFMGYTNAGKSTLFNQVTQSKVFAEDQLFATLHVTTRRLRFPHHQEVLFTDTVGFIRDLPKDLQTAFKATLEELYESDLLFHVVDISDPNRDAHIESVHEILAEMDLLSKPRALIFNKTDLMNPVAAQNLCDLHNALGVSALDRDSTRPVLDIIQRELGLTLLEWVSTHRQAAADELPTELAWQEEDEEQSIDKVHDIVHDEHAMSEQEALEWAELEAEILEEENQKKNQWEKKDTREQKQKQNAKRALSTEEEDWWS